MMQNSEYKLKFQPTEELLKQVQKKAGKSATAEEIADFIWESLKTALDMMAQNHTYDEYVLHSSLKGIPQWAQIEQKTWNSFNEEISFEPFH